MQNVNQSLAIEKLSQESKDFFAQLTNQSIDITYLKSEVEIIKSDNEKQNLDIENLKTENEKLKLQLDELVQKIDDIKSSVNGTGSLNEAQISIQQTETTQKISLQEIALRILGR